MACHLPKFEKSDVQSVGILLSTFEQKILDISTGKPLGVNQRGEIVIRSPSIMKGYLNRPEATASTLDKDGWLHTGIKVESLGGIINSKSRGYRLRERMRRNDDCRSSQRVDQSQRTTSGSCRIGRPPSGPSRNFRRCRDRHPRRKNWRETSSVRRQERKQPPDGISSAEIRRRCD
mgnify:CR=1 FL=1